MKKSNAFYKKNILKLFLIVFFIYIFYCLFIYSRFFFAVKKTDEIKNQDFLIFKIYGSSNTKGETTISAHFSILDSNENTITEIERSWNGNYLAVNFNKLEFMGKKFIFPSEIFAKEKIFENHKRKKGIKLEKYYNENGQCILFSKNHSKKSKKSLYVISQFINKKYFVPTLNFVDIFTIDLSTCKNDVFYVIFCDKNGNLILRQM